MFVSIILVILFILFSAWYDAIQIINHNYILSHASRAWLRLFILILIPVLCGGSIFVSFGLFFLAFDELLDLFRGLDMTYNPTTAKFDKIFYYLFPNFYIQMIIRLVVFSCCIIAHNLIPDTNIIFKYL